MAAFGESGFRRNAGAFRYPTDREVAERASVSSETLIFADGEPMQKQRGELGAFGDAGEVDNLLRTMQVVSHDPESVEDGQSGRGKQIAVGASADVLPGKREAQFGSAPSPIGEEQFFRWRDFLGWPVEAAFYLEGESLRGC